MKTKLSARIENSDPLVPYGDWLAAYRRIGAEATRRGMKRKVERGGLPGPAPLGYVNRRQGDRSWVEIDEAQGPLVRKAFLLAAAGKSIREVLATMTAKGLHSKRGNEISPAAFAAILRNSFYIGVMTLNGNEYPGTHEPLVSREDFATVQKGLAMRRRN